MDEVLDGDDKEKRREDSALTSQNFYSPKANIIVVFRTLTEKPSELLHYSLLLLTYSYD